MSKQSENIEMELNTFTLKATFVPPSDLLLLRRWLNIQHTGKPLVQFDDEVSDQLKGAHHKLGMHREMEVEFKIDMYGNWEVMGFKFCGRTYKPVEI